MQISQHHGLSVYERPIQATSAVVATAQKPEEPVGKPTEASEVSLSGAAKEMKEHLDKAGEGHAPDGCETCTGIREASLSESDKAKVAKMKARDAEVRQHESAHLAAAGSLATGGPSYEYERGPDGKQYAVGGHVNIDTSAEGDPNATLRKAENIRRAALAPAEPSGQDQRVAAKAAAMAQKARRELASADGGAPPDAAVLAAAAGGREDRRVVAPSRAIAGYSSPASR